MEGTKVLSHSRRDSNAIPKTSSVSSGKDMVAKQGDWFTHRTPVPPLVPTLRFPMYVDASSGEEDGNTEDHSNPTSGLTRSCLLLCREPSWATRREINSPTLNVIMYPDWNAIQPLSPVAILVRGDENCSLISGKHTLEEECQKEKTGWEAGDAEEKQHGGLGILFPVFSDPDHPSLELFSLYIMCRLMPF